MKHLALVMLCAGLMSGWTAPAADPPRMDLIEIRMGRSSFADFCSQLGLNSNQRIVADTLWRDYETAIRTLEDLANKRALENGMQFVYDTKVAGEKLTHADRLRVAEDVRAVIQATRTASDRARRNVVESVASLLDEAQTVALPSAIRALRRDSALNMLYGSDSPMAHNDLGVHADLIKVAVEAGERDNPLAAVMKPSSERPLVRAAIQEVLVRYELDIDALLRANPYKPMDAHLDIREAYLSGDRDRERQRVRNEFTHWSRVHTITSRAADAIEFILRDQVSPSIGFAWHDFVGRHMYPQTYRPDVLELLGPWLQEHADVIDAAALESAVDSYLVQRRRLRRLIVQRKIDEKQNISAWRRAEKPALDLEDRAEAELKLRELHTQRLGVIESLIPAEIRTVFRREVNRLRNKGFAGRPLRF